MYICSCRRISDQDHTEDELRERLEQDDVVCGVCLDFLDLLEMKRDMNRLDRRSRS